MKEFHFCTALSKKAIYLEMKNNDEFSGDVIEDSFSVMRRYTFHTKSVKPQIDAVISEKANTTQVDIKVGLHRNDKIGFCIMALLHCGLICYFIISSFLESSIKPIFPIFAVLIFDIISGVVFRSSFNYSVRKTLNKLKEILELT